jgi:mono/diheme cytochrome c family protein
MRTVLKILGVLVLAAMLAACGGLAYLYFAFPKVAPATDHKAVSTPELIARGEYLAKHVNACIDCHSTRDWGRFAGPIVPGTEGQGGQMFDQSMGMPGRLYAKNITPAGIGTWTDGEVLRAFTTGVSRDGRPMFPLMPYPSYGRMDPSDADAVLAYLRTLKPIENRVPDSKLDFPMNLVVRTIPGDARPQKRPEPTDSVAYGRYLATIAGCGDCHTPAEKGTPLPGMDFAGGFEFQFPDGSVVRSTNITPDPETGIGGWDQAFFVQRFKKYAEAEQPSVKPGELQSVMPWTMYAGMTEQDLGAIHDFLKTLKPVKHSVERFTAKKA